MPSDAHHTIEAVFRIESPKLIAGLARITRDVGVAEELAQDALVTALELWPRTGIPDRPGAWLMQAAKHRAIDFVRRGRLLERKHEQLGHELRIPVDPADAIVEALDDELGDDLLRLMFTSCHPILSPEARVALTLRLVGGLTTEEIARALLVPVQTIQQRIVRAKKQLAEAHVPFEVPRGDALVPRLASVLEVIYLVFNEGYTATTGEDWVRPELCEDALRLGRVLAGLAPGVGEIHGLVALMELQASRLRARLGPNGEPILLFDQDRARWDRLLIRRGLESLARAQAIGGVYTVQAAIAACHARAGKPGDTDWPAIAALYDQLARVAPSPIVELNRAVAVGMARGPAAGLAIADRLADVLGAYYLLPSVRADLLAKLGRTAEARAELARAAELTGNARERQLLLDRATKL
ncbi:MAG: RNA polymerase sigma factor [Kofleriaceae bacterium]